MPGLAQHRNSAQIAGSGDFFTDRRQVKESREDAKKGKTGLGQGNRLKPHANGVFETVPDSIRGCGTHTYESLDSK